MSQVTRTRARALLVLDWLILLLAGLTLLIALTGGFRFVLDGMVLSARAPGRPFVLMLVIGALRMMVAPRVPFLASRAEDWRRRRARIFLADADAVTSAIDWRSSVMAAAGLCVVAVILLFPQLRHMDSVPDHGDPLLSMWRTGWIFHQLQGDPRGLFDANIFHPEPLTFTYSDSMLLPGLTAAPLLAAGVHPVTAYNLVLISGFLFSGIAAALLVERLTGSSAAGFVAGIVFGFYPYHFEHYSHLELQMMQWMPLSLLAMHRFVETRSIWYALAAAVCAAAQLYSSMYYGVFFAIYAVVVLATLVATRRPPLKRLLMPAAIAAGLAVLLAVPLIRPYREATRTKGERNRGEVAAYSARRSDYLRAHVRSALYGKRMLAGREPERALFPGVAPLALAAAGLIPPLGAVRLAYVAGLLVAFDGSLGFNGFSYPYLFDWFSPIRGLRVPARFSVLVALSLAVLAGFGVRWLMTLPRRKPGARIVFGLTIAASVINVWPVLELVPVWRDPPPVYGALANADHVVLAEFPVFPDFAYDTPYMYFSLWHWAPMMNGYSGFKPKSFELYEAGVADFPGPVSMATMKMRGVTHVTVNCGLYRGGCPELLQRLDSMSELRKISAGLWQGQPVRLYELVR